MPRSGCSMVGDNKKITKNSVELEASLAPAEAKVGAVAKADQNVDTSVLTFCTGESTNFKHDSRESMQLSFFINNNN